MNVGGGEGWADVKFDLVDVEGGGGSERWILVS